MSFMSDADYHMGSLSTMAETFTVGVAGTLSEIDIFINATGSPNFTGLNILSTLNGGPTTFPLATGLFQSAAGGVAVFTTSLPVTIGEVLAIEPLVPLGDVAHVHGWPANHVQSCTVEPTQNVSLCVGSVEPGAYPGGDDYFLNPDILIFSFIRDGFELLPSPVPSPVLDCRA
jgi:hypothetical protein